MPQTEAQKKAKAKYTAQKVTQVLLPLYPTDSDIINKLNTVPAKATYIKQLIRADIEGGTK